MNRTSLTRYAPLMRDPDPVRGRETCREAFHKDGIVCISLSEMEERHGWAAARQLRNLGEQFFGKRGK